MRLVGSSDFFSVLKKRSENSDLGKYFFKTIFPQLLYTELFQANSGTLPCKSGNIYSCDNIQENKKTKFLNNI